MDRLDRLDRCGPVWWFKVVYSTVIRWEPWVLLGIFLQEAIKQLKADRIELTKHPSGNSEQRRFARETPHFHHLSSSFIIFHYLSSLTCWFLHRTLEFNIFQLQVSAGNYQQLLEVLELAPLLKPQMIVNLVTSNQCNMQLDVKLRGAPPLPL